MWLMLTTMLHGVGAGLCVVSVRTQFVLRHNHKLKDFLTVTCDLKGLSRKKNKAAVFLISNIALGC